MNENLWFQDMCLDGNIKNNNNSNNVNKNNSLISYLLWTIGQLL